MYEACYFNAKNYETNDWYLIKYQEYTDIFSKYLCSPLSRLKYNYI